MNSARRRPLLALTALSVFALAACHKKQPEAPTASESVPPAAAPAQAAAEAPALTEEQQALEDKKKALAFAQAENDILNDPKGQWAAAAAASSAYADATGQNNYAAWQATGKPNVVGYGDNSNAWAPKEADGGIEWLQLDFATPVHATALRIRQNENPGVIVKIETIDVDSKSYTIWEGIDDGKYDHANPAWLYKQFAPTTYLVKSVKLTLATNMIHGDNEIDAVQLISQ